MRIVQMLSTIAYGDAVSNDVFAFESVIKKMGYDTRIYAESIVAPLGKKDALPIDQFKNVKSDDILIYHFSTGSQLNYEIAKYPCKKILVYHNVTPPEFYEKYSQRFAGVCQEGLNGAKFLHDKVDYCLAVSEFNKNDLINMGYTCKIDVCPLVIPFKDYDGKPDKEYTKFLNDGKTNILFTGRIAPNKKQENIITAFYYYKKRYNLESKLILAGSYKHEDLYFKRLEAYVKKLGLKDDVIFTGHIKFSEILSCYKASDVFLCMSEHEGFCVPVVEAMYFNLPVIAYAKTAVPETMNYNGILLDDNNPSEVAGVIDKVVKDKQLRKNIVAVQNERLKDFSYEKISGQLEKLLTDFINNK